MAMNNHRVPTNCQIFNNGRLGKQERVEIQSLCNHVLSNGWSVTKQNSLNMGLPYQFIRNNQTLHIRFADLCEFTDIVITDNVPLKPVPSKIISVVPEYWSTYAYQPQYINKQSSKTFNCFMARARGDRDRVFNQLKQRNLLEHGFVSYLAQNYDDVNTHGTLEQCVIDSKISLVLETYTVDTQIAFSEKIFRALQLPRPWLLYCSPYSIELLKTHGFDVLEDYVDIGYDKIDIHWSRMDAILDQLETFVDKQYTRRDYERFEQAATHNQQLLAQFAMDWPIRLECVKLYIRTPNTDWDSQ
jgi:hypothetical protein|tara:strand:+ start:357 stop:1259 length:903 start_codon:yes stop_codon:yes gene_type:complete